MLSKRLARSLFLQGSGSNYRKLTPEEKEEAKKNFFESLKSQQGQVPKTRNLTSFFKDLIKNASIPVTKKIHSEYTIKNDKYTDPYN